MFDLSDKYETFNTGIFALPRNSTRFAHGWAAISSSSSLRMLKGGSFDSDFDISTQSMSLTGRAKRV